MAAKPRNGPGGRRLRILAGTTATVVLVVAAYSSGAEVISPTLQRPFEPILLRGSSVPELLGAPVHALHAFAYDADSCRWRAIPFQIDEVRDGDYFRADDGLLDPDDELVFFSADVGAKVPDGFWVQVPPRGRRPRVEIELTDPLDPTERGWIYLFQNVPDSLTAHIPTYLDFDGRADRVLGRFYLVGFNSKGILADIHITEAGGGTDTDLVDRQKQRVKGKYRGAISYALSEENIQRMGTDYKGGPVRVLRRLRAKLVYQNILEQEITFVARFYPRCFYVGGGGNIGTEFGVYHLRQSLDLNANAIGMYLISERNDSLRIDGVADPVDKTLPTPARHWWMVTGRQGTILTLADIPRLGTQQRFYYLDAPSGTADGTEDTGDGHSYGDAGVYLYGGTITGQSSFATWTYLLPGHQTKETGETFLRWWENPLRVRYEVQWPDTIPPAPIVDLMATPEGEGAVRLEWTAPGDDGPYGQAQRYDIRFSLCPPESIGADSVALEQWFAAATPLPDSLSPLPAGQRETRLYTGLQPRVAYYFALRALDEAGTPAPVSNVASALVVPVELADFRAHVVADSVFLLWVTGSERRNLGFYVERSQDGQSWQVIGFVPGQGSSTSPRAYRFADAPPPGCTYAYRLRQEDFDGHRTLSQEVWVIVPAGKGGELVALPNPFNESTRIRLVLPGVREARVAIYDALGRRLRSDTLRDLGGGNLEFVWTGRDLRGEALPSGVYVVRVAAAGRVFFTKLLLVR
ncbi:MAG: T9SS type A sorting domain-containing protein [candidate division KSB1 bacterium]|nr:T9SS type A sorting domain-containing protein [candidate division KSB1 bacterium]